MSLLIFWPAGAPAAFVLSASANISASGQATTAQLTAPAGKTSGADFQAGRIQDDENPTDAIDLASGKYTELEWSIKAVGTQVVASDVYEFRVVKASTNQPLDTYTVTPTFTVATSGTTGTGTIAFAGPALAGTGLETFTGTAAETFIHPALAATSAETFTGTAAEAVTVASLAGTAAETFTGTGSETFAVAALAATGIDYANTGTAAETFAVAGLAGTGSETFSGTGAETFAVAALSATSAETFTGTGTETFGVAALAGTGTAGSADVTGTGTTTFAVAGLSAAGAETFTGTGSIAWAVAGLAGTALQGPTGTATETFTGSAFAGTGSETFTSTAAEAFSVAALAGTGAEIVTGTAAVAFAVPGLSGMEDSSITGMGAVAFSTAVQGSGSAAVPYETIGLAGYPYYSRYRYLQPITGEASTMIRRPRLQAEGELGISGEAFTTISGPTIAGDGTNQFEVSIAITVRALSDGVGVIRPRRLVSVTAGDPRRSLSGVAAAAGAVPQLTAIGSVAQPDVIDRAWVDLQRDDEILLMLEVCDV